MVSELRPFIKYLLLLAFGALLILPGLSSRPFHSRGEAREALVAQDMFASSNYILPRGYSGVVPSKPPMLHWLISLAAGLCGEVDELSSRLPSALCSIIFCLGFFAFLQARTDPRAAFLAPLILVSSAEWLRSSSVARVDMTFSVFMAGALISSYVWIEEKRSRGVPCFPVIFLSLATLAKGPVALVLAAAILGVHTLFGTERSKVVKWITPIVLIVLPALLLPLVWYLLAAREGGEAFVEKIHYENVARFLGTQEDQPHKHGVFYLFGALLVGLLPWSILFLALPVLGRARAIFKNLVSRFLALPPYERLFIMAIAAFLAFFSIPSGKRGVYLLPVYPFIAYFAAKLALALSDRKTALLTGLCRASGILVILVCALAALASLRPDLLHAVLEPKAQIQFEFYQGLITGLFSNFMLLQTGLAALPFALALVLLFVRKKYCGQAFLAMYASFALILNLHFLPRLANEISPKGAAAWVNATIPKSEQLYSFGYEFYGLSFYAERKIMRLEESQDSATAVILYENDLEELAERLGENSLTYEVVGRSPQAVDKPFSQVVLVRVTANA
ncbi:MAG: hypothetical protein DCC75_07195 [Proteobacteria bacterium]|nr:MAG: hypothetical protein DCC75_07195 [Pseudomonadota bacterium]